MAHELRPKPKSAPERESANEWYAPAAMRVTGRPASERTGCGISNVRPAPDAVAPEPEPEPENGAGDEGSPPMPSCPNAFEPHAKSSPSAIRLLTTKRSA